MLDSVLEVLKVEFGYDAPSKGALNGWPKETKIEVSDSVSQSSK